MSYLIKVIITFIVLLFTFRAMGKKLMTQLTNYDLANILVIAMIAAGPLVTSDLLKAIYGMVIFICLHTLLFTLSRNHRFREYILGASKTIIEKGRVSEKTLKASKLTMVELLDELRRRGYDNVADVEFAIMENTGKMMIVPRNDKKPGVVDGEDSGVLGLPLIMDQRIVEENLRYAGYDRKWLMGRLKTKGVEAVEEVALATLNHEGIFQVRRMAGVSRTSRNKHE